ncbi:OLC1v1036541C1 [Oldenlandia corymbosa var. corymbosa]|uniref:OLC1v1036541C1 n=1 Tax=Oldenlandia corymbosa var. corymbosa TaxID=529605 RepID=A0AAV1CY94_OLDCO|nr:OLC1v1036541C1 [Oldenlandia corymbosa var. corymbosa]
MSKVHPEENQKKTKNRILKDDKAVCYKSPLQGRTHESPYPSILTVWKRSSMSFQGTDGFTVFDRRGRLVFRVENYTRKYTSWSFSGCSGSGGHSLLLMDGSGKALLTLKPQLMSLQHEWTAYRGELNQHGSSTSSRPEFTMRRPTSSLLSSTMNMIVAGNFNSNSSCEAEVFFVGEAKGAGETTMTTGRTSSSMTPDLTVQGCFRRRNCKIVTTDGGGRLVATVSRKRINSTLLLSDDVFRLKIQPGFEHDVVMAFVIILDRICYKSYTPILCS